MGDILSTGIPIHVHICGSEQVNLLKTPSLSEIKATLPWKDEVKELYIHNYGLKFESSSNECNHLLFELCQDD